MSIIELFPVVLTVVEVVKRFVPDRQRTIVNPVLAVLVGLIGAYATGGTQEVLSVLMNGVGAGVAAIAAYKVPKIVGSAIGVK